MSNEIIERESSSVAPVVQQDQHMRLFEMALANPNGGVDQLERLMALKEKYDSQNAKKSFLSAMAEFQRKCPTIKKCKQAHNSKYAPLGDIVAQIREPLADCGLSYRFEQDHGNAITVRCIVSHVEGHSEITEMTGGSDTSGNKSVMHAAASTVTYLSRYTLTGALGIATADEDVDGRLPDDPGSMNFYPDHLFEKNFPTWESAVQSGKKSADSVIATVESKYALTEDQKIAIKDIA